MIAVVRIDDRLIHGQVVTQWIKRARVNKIYIVDDGVAKDPVMCTICKGLAPAGVSVDVITVEKANTLLNKVIDHPKYNAMVIVKTPKPVLQMKEAGVRIDKMVLGGMQKAEGRTSFYKNISASEAEKDDMRKLLELGVDIAYQMVPDDTAVSVKDLL